MCAPSMRPLYFAEASPLGAKRIGALALLLFGLFSGTGGTNKVRAQVPSTRAQSKRIGATKWWYGETGSANGATAWWIRVEPQGIVIYDPPGKTVLCKQKSRAGSGNVWEANIGAARARYRIEMDERPDSTLALHGSITRLRGDTKEIPRASQVVFRPVLAGNPRDVHMGRSANYSNLSTNSETGDLLGKDLLLARTDEGIVGSLVMGEGAPSRPYAISNARVSGDTVAFQIMTEAGPMQYIAQVKRGQARLWRGDERESEMLQMLDAADKFLQRGPTRSCRS
ncbi:MAG: hypothetical protein JWM95_1691 [Gemmatimonadetes bacterium]|nr:hypothetical protein [Gemmatimonadota bacterium]